jgi:hypothetical protein
LAATFGTAAGISPQRPAAVTPATRLNFRGLSVGDVVAVGEVALAVARPAGWTPVCGDPHKVRTDGHGT